MTETLSRQPAAEAMQENPHRISDEQIVALLATYQRHARAVEEHQKTIEPRADNAAQHPEAAFASRS